jgi:hypothetical protein
MTPTISESVRLLQDQQALDACAALASALEVAIGKEGLDTSDFQKLLVAGSPAERALHDQLQAANLSLSEAAEGARSMLLLAADLGYAGQVGMAIAAAKEHGRDFGALSGPLLLAGLAVVLSYVPVEQRAVVKKVRYRTADGSEFEEELTETETKRVGAATVEKLASWWKTLGKPLTG